MNKPLVIMGGVIVAVLSAAALAGVTVSSNAVEAPRIVAEAPDKKAPARPKPKEIKRSVGGVEGIQTTEGGKVYFRVTAFDPNKRTGTLTFIAAQYHTNVDQLVAWNHIQDRDLIHVHQRLRVQ